MKSSPYYRLAKQISSRFVFPSSFLTFALLLLTSCAGVSSSQPPTTPAPKVLTVTTQALVFATEGSLYSAPLTALGGVLPYSWKISSGSLPAGIAINDSTGFLSGMTNQTGTFAFQADVTDSQGSVAHAALSILVQSVTTVKVLTVTTQALSAATDGSLYGAPLTASGGVLPYSWRISSGSPPAGIAIDASTGFLSGTTNETGTFAFQADVTDSQGSFAYASLSIIVQNTPEGSQFYVSPTGSNSNAGTQASPWLTIQNAVNSFFLGKDGATIHVAAGTYSDLNNCASSGYTKVNVCVDRGGSSSTVRLVLQCDAQWTVGSITGCYLHNTSASQGISVETNNVDVVGFEFGNVSAALTGISNFCYGTGTPGPCVNGNSVHIVGNYVHDIGGTGNDGVSLIGCPGESRGGGILIEGRHGVGSAAGYTITDAQVIGNRVTNIGSSVFYPGGSSAGGCNFTHAIYVNAPNGITENNIMMYTAGGAFQAYSFACNNVVSNNVIIASGRSGIIMEDDGDCGKSGFATGWNTVTNNIVDNGFSYGVFINNDCSGGHTTLYSDNIINGNPSGQFMGATSCDVISGTLSEAPTTTFKNYLGTELSVLELKSGGVAINGGTTTCASGAPYTVCTSISDFENYPWNSAQDIGAYAEGSLYQLYAPVGLKPVLLAAH